MTASLWSQLAIRRRTRRQALLAGGSLGAGVVALGLAGCSNSSSGQKSGSSTTSQNVYTPKDTSASAKSGGVLKGVTSLEVLTFDYLSATALATFFGLLYQYPTLLKTRLATYPQLADANVVDGYLAQSHEISADKLQITLKLRNDIIWDRRAPTNGRTADANDVVFSLKKFSTASPYRTLLFYNSQTAPSAPIDSVSAPDSKTVVIKMKSPNSSVLPLLAGNGNFFVMPNESDGGFDPKSTIRGSGAFILDDYQPSASLTFSKNPDFYIKGHPFVDKVEWPIVLESATRISQFRAGNIFIKGPPASDIADSLGSFQLKKDLPDLLMAKNTPEQAGGGFVYNIKFGYNAPDSPFNDQRVRQAVGMLIDRDEYRDVFTNEQKFKAEGVDIASKWDHLMQANNLGFYLDPQNDKEFGPNAKYYRTNIAEAKKLLSAAGYPNGFSTNTYYDGSGIFGGAVYQGIANILHDQLIVGGIDAKPFAYPNFTTGYQAKMLYAYTRTGSGFDSGLAVVVALGGATPGLTCHGQLHGDGRAYVGYPKPGGGFADNPDFNSRVEAILQEFDLQKQASMVKDLARLQTEVANAFWLTFRTDAFEVAWPAVGNFNAFTGTSHQYEYSWIDDSKAPLKKS